MLQKLFLVIVLSLSLSAQTVTNDPPPSVFVAEKNASDLWFPYVKRLLVNSHEALLVYGKSFLDKLKALFGNNIDHVPWTLPPARDIGTDEAFKLKDIVPDRITDPQTGKRYIKLYHGTTDDLVKVFASGAEAIRFDVAELTALGMGFYLAANINEAKYYACERLGHRKFQAPNMRGLLLVVGVLEDDVIQGKFADPDSIKLSDDKTGEALDPSIYFIRNRDRPSQFVFFKNAEKYLRIFDVITLPDGFGKAASRQDGDGLPVTSTLPDQGFGYRCFY